MLIIKNKNNYAQIFTSYFRLRHRRNVLLPRTAGAHVEKEEQADAQEHHDAAEEEGSLHAAILPVFRRLGA